MRPPKASLEAAFQQLKEMLSGAALRTVAGIKDAGEVLVATIGDGDAEPHDVDGGKTSAWVRFTDALTGLSGIGRLYAPAGILWRAAAKGDGAHVITGRKARGPGGPLVMPDGGNGSSSVVPDWFPDDAGLFETKKKLHVESSADDVHVDASASGKKVLLQGGGKGIARLDDTVNAGWLVITPGVDTVSATVIAYVGPNGPDPTPLTVLPMFVIPLRGKIDSASTKAESG